MIKSAITVSLVEEARGGPFVFWNGLQDAFEQAAKHGFDAVEVFAPGPDAVDPQELKQLCDTHQLSVAAVGTGAGMVKLGLSLTDPDAGKRKAAREFVKQMIDFGGQFAAPAIIGSMQGRWGGSLSRDAALEMLKEALEELGQHALHSQVPLIYEPLNRYETNLIKTMADGVQYLESLSTQNVRLLADLFHMNIEESDIADAIRTGGKHIGHVHFVDSNRQATGLGHMDYAPIAAALKEIGYAGYASAESLPIPDSETAAAKTIAAFNKYLR
ncbi:sugar phosphate isomerase/epimerase family protein [Aureliella helgolandensis]|uniref:D-tagatose 3-epimerase n=1 Tax=Aureliella helgolandensis TaxID=2527968 RepID=A0A518G4G0_9BACT|nr:sugar phosphate isomerase/epimerase family protein [Aureliella helgolandensis]QDV23478.1 D-tagatose 3-epimerase [Aureliella helgolandensis]